MGGIASVTRSCLAALSGTASTRLITLRPVEGALPRGLWDDPSAPEPTRISACGGSRLRFAVTVLLRQVLERPDVILYEHVDLAQCQTLLPRRLRRPYAVWGHGIELWRDLPPRKAGAIRGATALIFNSHFTRQRAAEFHPWIADLPWRVVPLCREPVTAPDSAPPPARHPWILTVGRLRADRPKGHREILQALPKLIRDIPDLHWHIVGEGSWKPELARLIAGSPAASHVTLHGFVSGETLTDLYRRSRVFAMPSHGEGFGLVYAEAMAHGLPCVGSTLDAAPEVIGEAGACVDPADSSQLEGAMKKYLQADGETFARFAAAAQKRAEFFTMPRFAADLRSALGEIARPIARWGEPSR